MTLLDLRRRGEYFAFRAFACVIEVLNPRQTKRLACALAWVFVTLLPRSLTRYDIAVDNISKAYGDELTPAQVHEIIHKMWIHLFRMVAEIIQFPRKFRRVNCRDVVVFRNRAV
ncbi:MAG TPA: lipid A biosynthesis acyltransferase, partial [Planctomicrobium sp.]|nr:lipid A biosynthesis acyltransferase [Planctomicrobium sp.]